SHVHIKRLDGYRRTPGGPPDVMRTLMSASLMCHFEFGCDPIFVVRQPLVSFGKLEILRSQSFVSEKLAHHTAFFCHPPVPRGLRTEIVRQSKALLVPSVFRSAGSRNQ